MTSFVKLYGSILDSTVWMESLPTKVVWITLLAMADYHGIVYASVPGLARRAGVTREECDSALRVLAAPDPDSKTPAHEGRRIEVVEGGFRLFNYGAYREKRSDGPGGDAAACYVYYAVDGDRVKIGSSKNPWARAATLRRDLRRPDIKIVAVERGGYDLENDRHRQFAADRVEYEWFRISPSLQAHIESLPKRKELTTVVKKVGKVAKRKLRVSDANYKDVEADRDAEQKEIETSPAESGNGQRPLAWSDEGSGIWRREVGEVTPGRFGKALKPVVDRYGWASAKAALECYIEMNEGKTRKLEWFAGDAVRWIKLAKMPCVDPETRELTEKGRMAYYG